MSSLGTPHPSDEHLLRYADGELPAAQADNVRKHLAACWECRAELEEIERTIGECVRYRKTVLETSLPPPPAPWFDIYRRFEAMDAAEDRRRIAVRWFGFLRGFRSPRQWVPAAALVVLVAFLVSELRRTPSVQAAELLHKAVTAARSEPPAPRRIQIRTKTRRLTRIVGAGRLKSGEDSALEGLFRAADYSWDDPLSAESYAQWRERLPDKRDEVRTLRDAENPERSCYRLRTTTKSGELVEATLKLRMRDLRAVEETLQFRNREWVEITELPEPPALAPATPLQALEAPAAAVPPPLERRTESPVSEATPGEELQVLAALHRAGADLGDPVEVTRSGGQILVSGVGIGAERQEQIRSELRAVPRVTVRFSDPSADAIAPERPGPVPGGISVAPHTGRLQADLEKQLGGRAALDQFADRIFGITDAFMSRVHALRRLAERFPPATEQRMSAQDRRLLKDLRREHADALAQSVADAQALVEPALSGLRVPAPIPAPLTAEAGSWQDATEELFGDARRTEALLVAMLGGAAGESQSQELPVQVLASLTQLRVRAENYQRLTAAR